jgi:hypothetical protein
MKGDFSRPSGANGRSYAGVLHQQGRVWLDSDWNDEVFTRLERLRAETADMLGACAVPDPFTGFLIEPLGPGVVDDFRIRGGPGAQGRCYVDGVLCHTGGSLYSNQPQFPDAAISNPLPHPTIASPVGSPPSSLGAMLVYLEVWQRLITSLQDPALRERALGGPDTTARLETVSQVKVVKLPDTLLGPTCATAAAFLPKDGSGRLSTLPPLDQGPADPCRIPDPESYTGRENALYRVEIHDGGDVLGVGGNAFAVALQNDAPANGFTLTLAAALTPAQATGIAHGTVLIEDDTGSSERVPVQSASGTTITLARGTINAYRAARSATVRGGAAFFKWSRTNASDAFAILGFAANGATLTLDALGRDSASALRNGDLVEICDDAGDLGPGVGWLTYVAGEPNPDALGGPSIALADPVPASMLRTDRHPIVRRWNGTGVAGAFDPANAAATPELDLGDGVRISFGGSDLRPGDYWQFTARAVDGTIEALDQAPPAGIRRRRVPLGVLGWRQVVVRTSARAIRSPIASELPIRLPFPPIPLPQTAVGLELISDCRSKFVPITEDATREDGIHVTGVFAIDGTGTVATLDNDADVPVNAIFDGIVVRCDQQLDPLSVARATAHVKVELPYPVGPAPAPPPAGAAPAGPVSEPPALAYQSVTLAGALTSGPTGDGGGAIKWTSQLDPPALRALVSHTPRGDRGLLTRVVLDGARIRSADGRLVLDGDTFGRAGADGRTLLQYPSGDGRRGGDFELWFWLTPEQRRIVGSVFVTNTGASTVTAFAATSSGATPPRATFGQNDLIAPTGIALDRAGNVFVANSRGTLIIIPGEPIFVATANQGLALEALVGPSTTVQTTDFSRFGGFVNPNVPPRAVQRMSSIQAARNITAVKVTRSSGTDIGTLRQPVPQTPIKVGPSRREFITYVNVFAAGAGPNDAPIFRLGGTSAGISSPSGIAVDASGQLYVANGPLTQQPGGHGAILRFAAGARDDTAPVAVLGGGNTNVQSPRGLAVDANGFLYVAEFGGSVVLVFPPNATSTTAPVILNFAKFTDPVERPFGIAVDEKFIYFTGNDGSTLGEIVIVPNPGPNATGTIAVDPATCVRIGGAGTTLQLPAGIAVDAAQNAYVVDGNSVKVFVTNGLKPGPARQGVVPVQITSSALQGATFIAYSAS